MKVIKIGSSSQQTRIAQACDRCRSKKIRCDGIRPCCSQCANVGFECKTSDKLSRRAFPRGYTESLEERVRQLEAEVRELKDLLDEKDEKIDMLSRIHSYSSYSPQQSTPPRSISDSLSPKAIPEALKSETVSLREDTFRVQESQCFLDGGDSGSYVAGSSSGRAFIGMPGLIIRASSAKLTDADSFKRKVQETGKSNIDFSPEDVFKVNPSRWPSRATSPVEMSAPPRVLSDQLITIYFQEWAPLFPILHRPAFLTAYEHYVAGEEQDVLGNGHVLAQLYLVFSIASLSGEVF
jgi:Fungal Zn(2)-Cys(6) binuclear cluster domain